MEAQTLHNFIYDRVMEICYDREYAYLQFVRAFTSITAGIMEKGATEPCGRLTVNGIKSGRRAEFRWTLAERLNYMGRNEVCLECTVCEDSGQAKTHKGTFELSLGERIE